MSRPSFTALAPQQRLVLHTQIALCNYALPLHPHAHYSPRLDSLPGAKKETSATRYRDINKTPLMNTYWGWDGVHVNYMSKVTDPLPTHKGLTKREATSWCSLQES